MTTSSPQSSSMIILQDAPPATHTDNGMSMLSDWLNLTPSKDGPLFSPSVRLSTGDVPSISQSAAYIGAIDSPASKALNLDVTHLPEKGPSSAKLFGQNFSLPTTGRTIYSAGIPNSPLGGPGPSMSGGATEPGLEMKAVLHPYTNVPSTAVASTMLRAVASESAPPLLSPASILRTMSAPELHAQPSSSPSMPMPLTVTLPMLGDKPLPERTQPYYYSVPPPEELEYPSYTRTYLEEMAGSDSDAEGEPEAPPSPTPLKSTRYDPKGNPWALPILGPPFLFRTDIDPSLLEDDREQSPVHFSTSRASSLGASSRCSTPNPSDFGGRIPSSKKFFRPSDIVLSADWRNDRRAYEAHRYGTRSKMPAGVGICEASVREVTNDLNRIRGGPGNGVVVETQTLLVENPNPKKRGLAELKVKSDTAPKRARKDGDRVKQKAQGKPQPRVVETTRQRKATPKAAAAAAMRAGRKSDQRIITKELVKTEEVPVLIPAVWDGARPPPDALIPPPAPVSLASAIIASEGQLDFPSSPSSAMTGTPDDEDYKEDTHSHSQSKLTFRKTKGPRAAKIVPLTPSKLHSRKRMSSTTRSVMEGVVDLAKPETIRSFPSHVPTNERFPLFYRRFPVSSFLDNGTGLAKAVYKRVEAPKRPPGSFNHSHATTSKFIWNLYQPRYVKGSGSRKEGMCPICKESVERGGLGKNEWFEMKTSAFNYHQQKFHGVSPTNGLPFSPPIAFRQKVGVKSQKHQKETIEEGQCHKCSEWIALEGPNCGDTKVKELYWWKHACTCHKGSNIEGEGDYWYNDEVAKAIREYEALHPSLSATPLPDSRSASGSASAASASKATSPE